MRLYSYWRSSSSWRVRIALHYKGLAFETVPVHLVKDGGQQHGSDLRAKNPMRQVPLLEDGDAAIAQSMAILEYLEERHPDPPLLPSDPLGRARVRQLAEIVNAGIQPLQNLAVLQMLEGFGVDKSAWAQSWIARGFAALEASAKPGAGRFLFGDAPTFADCYLVPQLYNARRYGVVLDPYPTLLTAEASASALDAFARAHPDQQPDAPPGGSHG